MILILYDFTGVFGNDDSPKTWELTCFDVSSGVFPPS